MKGLIVGNSHVGALRASWGLDHQIDVDFFAIAGGAGPSIRVENGRIFPVPNSPTLQTNIDHAATHGVDPEPFDYILFASLGLSAVRDHFPHALRNFSLAELTPADCWESQPLSRAFLELVIAQTFERTPGLTAFREICTLFDGPVLCTQTPLPVLSQMGANDPIVRIYGEAAGVMLSWYSKVQERLILDAVEHIRPGVTLLELPNRGWQEAGATPECYLSDSKDVWHMNARYGALVINQLRQVLKID